MLFEKSFLLKLFRDCFFHADMHPAIFLFQQSIHKSYFIAVDFGIMGILSNKTNIICWKFNGLLKTRLSTRRRVAYGVWMGSTSYPNR